MSYDTDTKTRPPAPAKDEAFDLGRLRTKKSRDPRYAARTVVWDDYSERFLKIFLAKMSVRETAEKWQVSSACINAKIAEYKRQNIPLQRYDYRAATWLPKSRKHKGRTEAAKPRIIDSAADLYSDGTADAEADIVRQMKAERVPDDRIVITTCDKPMHNGCRKIFGDPLGEWSYCKNPRAPANLNGVQMPDGNSPYCEEHKAVMYQKPGQAKALIRSALFAARHYVIVKG